jgi:hypothetical protein
MRALPTAAAAAILLASCAHRPDPKPAPPPAASEPVPAGPADGPALPPATPPPAQDPFARLRADVDALLRAQAEALWAGWTRGEPVDLAATYAGRERVFSADAVRDVHAATLRASGDERRALALLHGYVAGEHLARETAASAERYARARAATPVAFEGQQIPAERVPALLAGEADANRRAALQRAYAEASAQWAAAGDALVGDLDAAARRLGHPGLLELAGAIRGAAPADLARLADEVLDATGPAYEEAMEALARSELDLPLDALRGRDLPRLFRAVDDPRLFPQARVLADARALFGGLGLDPGAKGAGVTLDLAARPRKDPRALALPVDVPGDVRISFAPTGGLFDLRALLHEMGAASYWTHVASPRVEFRRLGDVVVRTWGLLFEEVAGDPAWLLERTGDTEHHIAPAVRAAAARRLHAARDAAARLLLEVRRPQDPARAREHAAQVLERAWSRPVSAHETALALASRDPLLRAADELRATLLAAQAEAFLASRAGGPPWWREARSGAWLRRAFADGARVSPEDLARAFGAPAVRPAALAEVARARVRWAADR